MSTQEKVRRRRLMRPESVAVRWMVVLATVIGGLAAAIPIGQAAAGWWRDRANDTPSTLDGPGTIEQGSKEADALVRRLFDATGGRRLDLDAVLIATPSQANGKATNGYTLFYNCRDGAGEPGADRCSTAKLFWASNPLPFEVRGGAGWHLVGTYSVVLDPNKGQVYDATIVAFGLTSVTG
jgi:hypothetical protein